MRGHDREIMYRAGGQEEEEVGGVNLGGTRFGRKEARKKGRKEDLKI